MRLERVHKLLTALAGIVVAISAIIQVLQDLPFPPLSWIAGNRPLGIVVLAVGGLAVLVTILAFLGPLPRWLLITGLVSLYVVIAVLVARVLLWPAPSVSITAPRTGALVPTPKQTVEGTSVGPVEDKLWIVVRVASPNPGGPQGYFPQEGPIPLETDGYWKAQITVGNLNSARGESFLILAVLADTSEARTEFQAFITACGTGTCPQALTKLPDDIPVLDQISVARG